MYAVILAAGRGTRMNTLTDTLPKPLLQVAGKSLLEHKLDVLPDSITDVCIIVGYKGELIKEHLGTKYGPLRLHYVEQKELNGTGGALWLLQERLDSKFLVLMGDDLYTKKDIETCLEYEWAYLVEERRQKTDSTFTGGNVIVDAKHTLQDIRVEECTDPIIRITTGLYVLQPTAFSYTLVPKAPGSTEYGLPHTLVSVAKDFPIHVLPSTAWMQVTRPEDIPEAETWLIENR